MSVLDPLKTVVATGLRERQTAATHVADALRAAIQRGNLVDGTELNQVALAEHFGISRVPVREALRSLEAEGWITALPHRRAIVQPVSLERVEEIFRVRTLLEAHLLETSIARMDDARINGLRSICDAMDAMRDHHEWVSANRTFHRLLLGGDDAPMTISLIEQLTSQVERYVRAAGDDVIREREAGDEHRAILDAVVRRERATAQAHLSQHIDTTRRHVIAAIGERQRTAIPTQRENL